MPDVLCVFRNNESKLLVGELVFGESDCRFSYDPQYLLRGDSEPLLLIDHDSPIIEKSLEGSLSIFKDAMPGVWGKTALSAISGDVLFSAELLLADQFSRVGDLVFSRTKQFPQLSSPMNFQWDELLEAKDRIERHQSLSDKQKLLLKQGSCQGGARPKISLIKNNELYLVKLPSINDGFLNVPQIEHGTLSLAKMCGINAAQSELLRIGEREVLLIKRFDRDNGYGRPYMSLASACGLRNQDQPSYLEFAEQMPRLGAAQDLEELFKRMLFNVLVSNKDDHQFNHGLLKTGKEWRLAPAFDVVVGEGTSKVQSMIVGNQYRDSTVANVLSKCDKFRLTKARAKEISAQMLDTINLKWREVFRDNGVNDEMINKVAWAIIHPGVLKGYEKQESLFQANKKLQ